MRRLYRILKGKACYHLPNTDPANFPVMGENSVFGEVVSKPLHFPHRKKFLHTGIDGANVVALEKTVVLTIEAYYLNILFQLHPLLAAKYVSCTPRFSPLAGFIVF